LTRAVPVCGVVGWSGTLDLLTRRRMGDASMVRSRPAF
jgi:hypothetical protein